MAEHERRALLTGISGQDGSFLAELLLGQGYRVSGVLHGGVRASLGCSEHLRGEIELLAGELLEPDSLRAAIAAARPDELYHLAAPSFIPASWERPDLALRAITGSTAAILGAVREGDRDTRVFVASSAAMFGDTGESPQSERTRFAPGTPYAIAKLAGHQLVGALRTHAGLFACSGILFNHESERRPEQFVTRKIIRGAVAVKLGLAHELELGDLTAVRDWSFAGDIMRGAWMMLQAEQPRDYVLASGVGRTVGDFARAAFACLGLDAEQHLRVSGALLRPAERTRSVGDPALAHSELGWSAALGFQQLVERMVQADLHALRQANQPT